MTKKTRGSRSTGGDKRVHIEALLDDYPEISAEELDLLTHWFRKQASAMDVGKIAQNEKIRRGYQLFKADHIDKFTLADSVKAALFLTVATALIFGVGYLAI